MEAVLFIPRDMLESLQAADVDMDVDVDVDINVATNPSSRRHHSQVQFSGKDKGLALDPVYFIGILGYATSHKVHKPTWQYMDQFTVKGCINDSRDARSIKLNHQEWFQEEKIHFPCKSPHRNSIFETGFNLVICYLGRV